MKTYTFFLDKENYLRDCYLNLYAFEKYNYALNKNVSL